MSAEATKAVAPLNGSSSWSSSHSSNLARTRDQAQGGGVAARGQGEGSLVEYPVCICRACAEPVQSPRRA